MSINRLDQLLKLRKESPKESFLLFALAKEYENREDWEQAKKYYHQLIEQDPKYVGCYYHLGKVYELLGDEEKALSCYTSGLKVAVEENDMHSHRELAAAKLNLEITQ